MRINMEILYIALIIALAILLPIGLNYLKTKNLLSQASLDYTVNLFKIGSQIVNELDLPNEKMLDKITSAVLLSLNYACDLEKSTDRINIAINYCIELCNQMGIEMTDSRLSIIESLITIGFTDKPKTLVTV